LLLPNRKKGIVYKLAPVQETKKEDYIGFYVHMVSTNSVSYLERRQLIIEYNTKAFGENIISNGKLIYDIPRTCRSGGSSRHNAIPEYFEVTLRDITSNKVEIERRNTGGIDSCLQLLPQEKGVYSAILYFLPQINVQAAGIPTI